MRLILSIILIVVALGSVFAIGLNEFKNKALTSADNISYGFRRAKESLFGFNPTEAGFYFAQIRDEISSLQRQLPILSNFVPLLKNLPPIFTNLNDLTIEATNLTDKLDYLKTDGVQLVIQKRGKELVKILKEINEKIDTINGLTKDLRAQAITLKVDLGSEISAISPQLSNASDFLGVFIDWLDSSRPRHLLIMFQNPSEIRPSGGFLGSFGHITLKRGSLVGLEVNDIYDFDGQLKEKIIPPKQLQSLTTGWGARDANWFFDFPTSARKTAELLEKSLIYQERDVEFDGAIAINVEIIKDVLAIIGPIELEDGELIIDADNFLEEVQRDVEIDQNKDILKELTPLLFEKLGELSDGQKTDLVEKIKLRIENKDIMIYLDDLILESYLQNLGIGGEVSHLPNDYFGEYLAVVNANIAGGKTDAFIDQQIQLASRITNEGEILNNLKIIRVHSGGEEKDFWYNKTNQNFVQILTPLGSELINIEGGEEKKIKSAINYNRKGYRVDEELRSIEGGPEQFGKQTFSTWSYTDPGQTSVLEVKYKNPGRFEILKPKAPQAYTFIFDKQSGVRGGLEFSIEAPLGFIWQESSGPYFIYKNKKPPARVVIELSLISL